MNVIVPTFDSMNENCTLDEMYNHEKKEASHDNKDTHDCCHHFCLQHIFVTGLSASKFQVDAPSELGSLAFPKHESLGYSSYLSLSIKPPIFS